MITYRDNDVIKFIQDFKAATTDTIAELFYPSLRVAQRRLRTLAEHGELKREREHFTMQYYYYTKKPKQLRHRLIITNFYRELSKIAEIVRFDTEVHFGDIRADGMIAYKYKNKAYIALLEAEISNKGVDMGKYENFQNTGKYKAFFPVFPQLIFITDRKIKKTDLEYIKVDEACRGIKLAPY